MEEVEVPKYFMCPISLQMMRDPVTALTGITYDRESIETWLSSHGATCPVTNQPLPADPDPDLTPNHTLRRLIQAWCVAKGLDPIPTPRPPLDPRRCVRLARALRISGGRSAAMEEIEGLARESDRNRKLLADAGVAGALAGLVVRSFKERDRDVEEALRILNLVGIPDGGGEDTISKDGEFFESLGWALREGGLGVKAEAVKALRLAVGSAGPGPLERMRLELFMSLTAALRELRIAAEQKNNNYMSSVKAGLEAMVGAGPWGRNRAKMVEAGAVFEAVEVMMVGDGEGRGGEVAVAVLAVLCGTAEGRARLVGQAGGIAGVARVLLRGTPAGDDGAVTVLAKLAGLSARPEVLAEMMAVGAVAKLCMVVQADCHVALKEKATAVLKMHSRVWSHSPCVALFLTSRPR